jgi:CBS-domain-containing membrane protein
MCGPFQEATMRIHDVMSDRLVSISPDATISDAISTMLRNRVSGVPVIDETRKLVGIISEGDFMRRLETGTLRRPHWLEWLLNPNALAHEYAQTRGQFVHEVMTPDVVAVQETADVAEAVELMQARGIKRLPVLRGEDVVGIVTRSDLMRALASFVANAYEDSIHTDDEIRAAVIAEMNVQVWAPIRSIVVDVEDGVVTLKGIITDDRQRNALKVAAENVPGVKSVNDQLELVDQPPVLI